MRKWLALRGHLFFARNRASASSILNALDGGWLRGMWRSPPVERAFVVQLCPRGGTAWLGNPRLPSKALKQLYEGSSDSGLMQELHTVTDLAVRATKVTARSLGQTMSTLVVQEYHLWLDLADMSESDKLPVLPNLPGRPLRRCDGELYPEFSITQKRTEAIGHILPLRPAAVITPPPVAASPPARRRGCPPAAPTFAPARPQQQHSLRQQCGAGSRKMAQPVSAPARPVKCQGKQHSWDGRIRDTGSSSSRDGESAPSPGGGPGENLFFPFWVVLPLALRPVLVSSRPNLQSSFLCFEQRYSCPACRRLKWNLFVDWCSPRREDSHRCLIAVVLFPARWFGVKAVSLHPQSVCCRYCRHDAVDGKSVGKNNLVNRFLRGARRLNPPCPHLVSSWDLP